MTNQTHSERLKFLMQWMEMFNLHCTPVTEEDPGDMDSLVVWNLSPYPIMVGLYTKPVYSPFLDGTPEAHWERWWIGKITETSPTRHDPGDWSVDVVLEDLGDLDMWKQVCSMAVIWKIEVEAEAASLEEAFGEEE